ncbi:MAG TPA: DUF1697 domain-containing protein [Terriglobales bacterium]|nr:DUF1697 domain-containing protein [Terriglobales bacterium]
MVYIALLRGINIGPHKRMKMEKLRASCETLGFKNVKTYIQSGNVVCKAGKLSSEAAAKKIEAQIEKDFGFSVDVIARMGDEMKRIVTGNPLLKDPDVDASKLHVVFLSETPPAEAIKKLEAIVKAPDQVRHKGKEIYFYFPNGVSGSSIWKHNLDRVIGISGTMRNWRTVNTLYQMAGKCE